MGGRGTREGRGREGGEGWGVRRESRRRGEEDHKGE